MKKMKSGGVTSEAMKKYGRNVARAMNQSGRAKGPSTGNPFKSVSADQGSNTGAAGKMAKNAKAPDQAIVNEDTAPYKPTKIRGTGAATKGTMARGPMG
jgi:hypothetical protein